MALRVAGVRTLKIPRKWENIALATNSRDTTNLSKTCVDSTAAVAGGFPVCVWGGGGGGGVGTGVGGGGEAEKKFSEVAGPVLINVIFVKFAISSVSYC